MTHSKQFLESCTRVRLEFPALVKSMEDELDKLKTMLVHIDEENFKIVQGRARELERIVDLFYVSDRQAGRV